MSQSTPRPSKHFLHRLRTFVLTRPRLLLSAVLGLIVWLALPADLDAITRGLVGWNVAVWLYLCAAGWFMIRATHVQTRKIAEQEDEGAVAILALMSIAAVVSIAAIVLELAGAKDVSSGQRLFNYAFTAVTVFGSWCFVGTLFTFHYAQLFYNSAPEHRVLAFPDDAGELDYWDFLYFSFTIAVAAQTADVAIMSRSVRKTVLAQSILSFLFNIAIFGLSINIAAGLIGS